MIHRLSSVPLRTRRAGLPGGRRLRPPSCGVLFRSRTRARTVDIPKAVRRASPRGFRGRAPCRSRSTSSASSSRSSGRSGPMTRGLLTPYKRPTRGCTASAGSSRRRLGPDRRRAGARRGRDQCHPDLGGGLDGRARLQHVGGHRLPAHDRPHHRTRPRQGPVLWQGLRAARDRRAGKQAGSGLIGRLEERWRRRQEGDR
jgi:hypothetical protein